MEFPLLISFPLYRPLWDRPELIDRVMIVVGGVGRWRVMLESIILLE